MTSKTPFIADFEILDFDAIREHLAREARTPYGRERALNVLPSADPSEVRYRLRLTTEARRMLTELGGFGLGDLPDVRPLLARLRLENVTLTVDEIHALSRTMEAGLYARATLRPHRERFPRLSATAEAIPDFRDTLAQVRRIVAPDGQLDEQASPELQRLRREQQIQRDRLERRLERLLRQPNLEGVFSDDIVTQRHGRFVIPVRDDCRGRVAGVIHGMSGSGLTVFVEPLDAIPLNNELTRLQDLLEAEVLRLLQEATHHLQRRHACLVELVTSLAELDLVMAQARLAERLRAVEPLVSETGRFQLTAARHPLLMLTFQTQGREVVPLSLMLDTERRALVVSGANAGGKTVVLKTAGLCVLLAQSGLHVPAQAAELPILRQVRADIGDQQSLVTNLSTFSSHITKLARVVAELTSPALVLLDEVGTGTDPDEGAALAQALIEHFRACGAYVLATTHFNALKIYADSTPGVMSAAVAFDLETLTPTYQLQLNTVGSSSGLVIARRLGLPEALIEQAQGYLRERDVILARYVAELERRVNEVRDAAAALDEERAALAERYARLEQEFVARDARRQADVEARIQQLAAAFESRLASLLERIAEAETRERLRREAARHLETTVADLKKSKSPEKPSLAAEVASRHPQKSKATQRALVAESLTAQPVKTAAELRPGDRVRTAFGTVGQVEAVSGDEVTVTSGALRLKVLATTLAKLPPAKPNPASVSPASPARQMLAAMHDVTLEGRVPLEVNLIGLTTDEATDVLDRYLDRAVLAGLTQVRVIHGVGTGALRKAVEAFLLTHPHVESFARADRRQGGDGATLVTLHP
ncbi:MAG: endonuclease MutS2 [Acidobacteriota bacterium]